MGKLESFIIGAVAGAAAMLAFAFLVHHYEGQGCERTLMVDECQYIMGHWEAAQ